MTETDTEMPLAVCHHEGGVYCAHADPSAPIRFYADGRVEDEVYLAAMKRYGFEATVVREYVSPEELARIVDAAREQRGLCPH